MTMFGSGNRIMFTPEGRLRFEDRNGESIPVNEKTSVHLPASKIGNEALTSLCHWLAAAYQQTDPQAHIVLEFLPDGKRSLLLKAGTFRFPPFWEPLRIEHTDEELNAAGIRCITWLLEALSKLPITHARVQQVSTWRLPEPKQGLSSRKP